MSRTILVCQHESCPRLGAAAVLKAFKAQAPADVVVKSLRDNSKLSIKNSKLLPRPKVRGLK